MWLLRLETCRLRPQAWRSGTRKKPRRRVVSLGASGTGTSAAVRERAAEVAEGTAGHSGWEIGRKELQVAQGPFWSGLSEPQDTECPKVFPKTQTHQRGGPPNDEDLATCTCRSDHGGHIGTLDLQFLDLVVPKKVNRACTTHQVDRGGYEPRPRTAPGSARPRGSSGRLGSSRTDGAEGVLSRSIPRCLGLEDVIDPSGTTPGLIGQYASAVIVSWRLGKPSSSNADGSDRGGLGRFAAGAVRAEWGGQEHALQAALEHLGRETKGRGQGAAGQAESSRNFRPQATPKAAMDSRNPAFEGQLGMDSPHATGCPIDAAWIIAWVLWMDSNPIAAWATPSYPSSQIRTI